MRSILALIRASFQTAASYRAGIVLSIAGLAATFVPVYFIAASLQDKVGDSIALEGGNYFAFLVFGLMATYMMVAALSAVPNALGGTISSGTLEALVVTRTPLYQILVGMAGYPLIWNALKSVILVAGGVALGVHVTWTALPAAIVVMALIVVAYGGLGLIAGALVLMFRTSGPLIPGIVAASGLLGGVYWSTGSIPGWLHYLSSVIPLTYGLRAMRMLLLDGAPLSEALPDILKLAVFAGVLLVICGAAFSAALRHARIAGTLSQY